MGLGLRLRLGLGLGLGFGLGSGLGSGLAPGGPPQLGVLGEGVPHRAHYERAVGRVLCKERVEVG